MLRFLRKEKNDRVDQRMVLKASRGVEEVCPCFYYNIKALKSNILLTRSRCPRRRGGMEKESGQLLGPGGGKDSGLPERDL